VRHPLYGALLLLALSWALLAACRDGGSDNGTGGTGGVKVLLCGVLTYLLDKAAAVEEQQLLAIHPQEYERYRKQVKHKLIPFLY
jgi:protein-S-isoprenylcysteine O-methyltransferase Ste14